jgi:uncharacterized membrane protein
VRRPFDHHPLFKLDSVDPVELLAKRQWLNPSLADRLMCLAERRQTLEETQAAHSRVIERSLVKHTIRFSYVRLCVSFALAATGLLGILFLIHEGKQLGAAATFVGSVASLARVFLWSRRGQGEACYTSMR